MTDIESKEKARTFILRQLSDYLNIHRIHNRAAFHVNANLRDIAFPSPNTLGQIVQWAESIGLQFEFDEQTGRTIFIMSRPLDMGAVKLNQEFASGS